MERAVAIDPGSARVVAAVPGGGVVFDESTQVVLGPAPTAMAPWPGLPAWSEGKSRARRTRYRSSVEMLAPEAITSVIRTVLDKLGGGGRRLAIVIPVGLSTSARAALRKTAQAAGAVGEVTLVEAPVAAALSLEASEIGGAFLVAEIGSSSTQAALFRPALPEVGASVPQRVAAMAGRSIGSRDLDTTIRDWLASTHRIAVSDATAARITREVGSAWPTTDFAVEIAGRSVHHHLTKTATLAPEELRHVTNLKVNEILRVLRRTLHHPDAQGVKAERIFLTGGGSLLNGLAERVGHEPDLPTFVVDDPHTAAARGAASLL